MSGLRGRSAVAADHRSVLPQIPGIPWWGAAIVGTAAAVLGFAFSGNEALGGVFATFYVLGCVLAVLVVRQSGVFTAVIQPPLILFVIVPFAYFVFHGSTFTGIKDTLINFGYPLIERFPLMFYTSAVVLVIGMIRWFVGAAARRAVPTDDDPAVDDVADEIPAAKTTTARRSRRTSEERPGRSAATAGATAGAATASSDEPARPPRRSARATSASRSAGSSVSSAESRRSRHAFPPDDENIDDLAGRPRRRNAPPIDPGAEPRRRPRSSEPRSSEPREPRDRRESRERRPLPPVDRRGSYERPERTERPQRRERPDPFERERPERTERPQRRPRVSSDYEPPEPPPTTRANGSGTHHPVSRVRYRNTDDGESRTEHRTRPRPSRHSAPESWEYDV